MTLRSVPGLCTVLIAGLASACIVDGDARCGDDRVFGGQTCVCPPGTADSAADKTCKPVPDAGTRALDASIEDGSSADAAEEDASSLPTGIGVPCSSSDDCAAYDAKYCESFQTHQCLIEHCAVSPDDCPAGYECCDLSSLGLNNTLCVPDGQCPTR